MMNYLATLLFRDETCMHLYLTIFYIAYIFIDIINVSFWSSFRFNLVYCGRSRTVYKIDEV